MLKHMPWSSQEEGKSSQGKPSTDEEESLTSTLDAQQRSELTRLIAGATASMRETLESNFDASVSLDLCSIIRAAFDGFRPLSRLTGLTIFFPKMKRS